MSLFDDLHQSPMAEDAAAFFEEANQAARPSPSVEAYHAIETDLPRREGLVLVALYRYISEQKAQPTSYELFQWMLAQGRVTDLNDVRPRLTKLHELERVAVSGRRACTVTRKSAYTWRPRERS